MGKRAVVKAKANKKSASAARATSGTPSGWSMKRGPAKGHIKKAKHHHAQEKIHKEASRGVHISSDTGKVKSHNTNISHETRVNISRVVREHDKAARAHGAAKRAHIKAAKSRGANVVPKKLNIKAPSASQTRKKK